jgi:hypothetical protein
MLSSEVRKAFESFAGKRIPEKQIRAMLQVADYEEYYKLFQEMLDEGLLEPVKSSGFNGMNPPLFKRYRVYKPEESFDNYIPEIRRLHSALNIEGYLNNPKMYKEHKKWLDPLDAWLKVNDSKLDIPVSINERSFQIFHLEKALKEDKNLSIVLNYNQGIRELLNYYDTPEPFFTHNIIIMPHNYDNEINILISENKDTWYTLRKLMNQSKYYLFGIPFHVLIYGEGKKINRKYNSLTDYDDVTFSGYKTTYYYLGDIDYEGIYIFSDLVNQNPNLDIRLMTPLYRKMLDKSKNLPLPVTKDKQSPHAMDGFLSYFEPEEQVTILKILEKRRYIPQEILNYKNFLEIINHV